MLIVLAFDIPGEQNPRTESLIFSKRVSKGRDQLDLITDVSYRRHAGREISRAELSFEEMRVHVPQSRHEIFASRLHDPRAGWNSYLRARPNCGDPIALDDNHRIGHRSRSCA